MDLTSYIVIGAVVSAIVQYVKFKFGTEKFPSTLVVIGISIVVGTVYYFVKDTSLWQPIIGILGFAGAVYTYIFQKLESKNDE